MKKLFVILIILIISLPIFAENLPEAEGVDIQTETTENTETVAQYDIMTKDTVSVPETAPSQLVPKEHLKRPMSKKKLAKKFLIAMLCVTGTSIFVYGTLKIYNNICSNINKQIIDDGNCGQSLEAPQEITEAVKSFVEKTKWEN